MKALAVFALAALAFLPALGAGHVWSKDESRPALVAEEMLATGDWAVPHIGGRVYVEKPPLFPWTVLLVSPGRVTAWSLRLPAALAAAGAVAATYLLGRRLVGPPGGLVAAGVLASSFTVYQWARTGRMEAPLLLWITLGFWSLQRWLDGGRHRDAALLGLFTGLGVLTKGPAGLLPLGVAALAVPFAGAWRRGLARPALLAAAGAALPILTWLAAAALTSDDFATWLAGAGPRVVQEVEGRPSRPPAYALGAIAAGFLPWTAALPAVLVALARDWRRAGARLRVPLSWAAAVLVVFGALVTPREVYFLPIYPALALLTAWAWQEHRGAVRAFILGGPGVVLLALGALAAGISLGLLPPLGVGPGRRILIEATGPLAGLAALSIAAPLAAWALARAGRAHSAIVVLAALALAVNAVLEVGVHAPAVNRVFPVPAAAARFAARLPADAPVAYADVRVAPALAFYLPNPVIHLRDLDAARAHAAEPGAYLLLPEPDAARLRERGVPLREIDRAVIDRLVYVLAAAGAP